MDHRRREHKYRTCAKKPLNKRNSTHNGHDCMRERVRFESSDYQIREHPSDDTNDPRVRQEEPSHEKRITGLAGSSGESCHPVLLIREGSYGFGLLSNFSRFSATPRKRSII